MIRLQSMYRADPLDCIQRHGMHPVILRTENKLQLHSQSSKNSPNFWI
jgi:hypothetical protein